MSQYYSYIDPEPLASASVAQVHRARVRGSREEVVIKVRKPGVDEVLKADLGFLYISSRLLEIVNPDMKRLSLSAIVGDIRETMMDELDFNKELANLVSFRSFLKAKGMTDIATAPKPIPSLTTKRVLTMEFLDGVPLVDLDSIRSRVQNPEMTLMHALSTWATSVAEHESFHADVHAGNLLVLKDGRVGFIDFGIVGRISDDVWDALAGLVQGISTENFTLIARSLAQMGATESEIDIDQFANGLEGVFRKMTEIDVNVQVDTLGRDGGLSSSAGISLSVDDNEITDLVLQLVDVAEKNGLKLPREFGLLMKQALYFDRYQKVLAPDSDPLRDPRLMKGLSETDFGRGARPTFATANVIVDVDAIEN